MVARVVLLALCVARSCADDVRRARRAAAAEADRRRSRSSRSCCRRSRPTIRPPRSPPASRRRSRSASTSTRPASSTAVDVVEPVGDGFDEAAVAAALQYVFEPGRDRRQAGARSRSRPTINFVIEQQAEPEPPPPPPPPKEQDGPPNHAGAMSAAGDARKASALERGTRRKLAGVIVSIAELGLDAVTGDDGTFYFHGVAPGHVPSCSRSIRSSIGSSGRSMIAKRETLEVRLWMRRAAAIRTRPSSRASASSSRSRKRTLQRQQLTSVPGTFGDPIRVIQTLPGMQRAPFGLGLLLVRGTNPDDTGIFVDGHEVPSLFHFLGGPSIFNAEMLESIDLYPGRLPGAVRAPSRRRRRARDAADEDRRHPRLGEGRSSSTPAATCARRSRRTCRSRSPAGARTSTSSCRSFLPEPIAGAQRIVTPVYYDYQARLDYNLHADGRAERCSRSARRTRCTCSSKDADTHDVDEPRHRGEVLPRDRHVHAPARRRPQADAVAGVGPRLGHVRRRAGRGRRAVHEPRRSSTTTLSYRMRVHGKLRRALTLDTGLDVLVARHDVRGARPGRRQPDQRAGRRHPAVAGCSAARRRSASARTSTSASTSRRGSSSIPSLRLDGYIIDGQDRALDRSAARRALQAVDRQCTAQGATSASSASRRSPRRSTPVRQSRTSASSTAITTASATSGSPTGCGRSTARSTTSIAATSSCSRTTSSMNDDGTFSYVNFHNTGPPRLVRLRGADQARDQRARVRLAVVHVQPRRARRNRTGDDWFPTAFDQPHVLNAVASCKPGGGWELGARFQLASGRPDTPVIGATFDADCGCYDAGARRTRSIAHPDVHPARRARREDVAVRAVEPRRVPRHHQRDEPQERRRHRSTTIASASRRRSRAFRSCRRSA